MLLDKLDLLAVAAAAEASFLLALDEMMMMERSARRQIEGPHPSYHYQEPCYT